MNRALPLLLLLSALLALGYAWATPVGAAPDEGAHLQYVRALATEGRLPALELGRRRSSFSDPNYESHQPPLYYALAVPFFHAGRLPGLPDSEGQACRLASILAGLAGTWLIWLLAREVLPHRPAACLAAAGIAALLPMRLAVMASVSNDSLAEALGSLALLTMVRGAAAGFDLRRAALLGGAIALALLAKQSAVLLLPPALLAIYLGHPTREGAASFMRAGTVTLGTVLALSGWWFARNHLLYGDPLGQRAFNWYFADTPRWADFRDGGMPFGTYLGRLVLPVAFVSFWGAFGHLSPEHPELFLGAYGPGAPGPHWGYPPKSWVYPLLLTAVAAAALGGLRAYLRWKRAAPSPEPRPARRGGRRAPVPAPASAPLHPGAARAAAVLALHGLFVFAAFLNFNATYYQAQGRYLFPALGVQSIGLAAGWLEWARGRETAAAAAIGAALLALATYALFGVLVPGF